MATRPLTQPEAAGNASRRGSYALVLQLKQGRRLRVGRLGVLSFPPGYYLYFGSALNGLPARIARHLRQEKKLHWHIDSLTQVARPICVWALEDGQRRECEWAGMASALPWVDGPVRKFGSSDCRCPTHLVHVKTAAEARRLVASLNPEPVPFV